MSVRKDHRALIDHAKRLAKHGAQIRGLRELTSERMRWLRRTIKAGAKSARELAVATQTAVDKAENAQRTINSTQNEFRGALKDAQDNFVQRPEFYALRDQVLQNAPKADVERLRERVTELEKINSGTAGRGRGLSAAQALLFQILPLAVSVLAIVVVFVARGQSAK